MSDAKPTRKVRFRRICVELAQAYVACMALAVLFHLTLGDASPVFFAAGSLALYFFLPLPLLLAIALWTKRRELWIGGLLLIGAWLLHWGALFSPLRLGKSEPVAVRVATYNLLGFNHATEATIRELELADADLVSLQELNPEMATAIERDLGAKYPYRRLDARAGVSGGGVLSRWPLEPVASPLQQVDDWVGVPIVSKVSIGERQLYFVQFHTASGTAALEPRGRQAAALSAFAKAADLPVIAAGDFNATDTSDAYAQVRESLDDAWAEVGFGFGHTFPGEPGPDVGGSRPMLGGIPSPKWLIRIDFIFHSEQLVAEEAAIVPSSGGSDHRMLVAGFRFK